MDFNFPQNIRYCREIVQAVSNVLFYSHIPSVIASTFIAIYILRKSGYSLLGKILFAIAATFSVWVLLNLIIWVYYYENSLLMASWAPIEIFSVLLFILCLYFSYVFIEKKDASIWLKLIALAPLFIGIAITSSSYNLQGYDIQECIAVENPLYVSLFNNEKIIFSLLLIIYLIVGVLRNRGDFRKQIILLSFGQIIFLMSFFLAGYIAMQTEVFEYEAIGLFGMVVFVGFLGYLIVKFHTFNIKLIGAQALVVSLVFLIGSELFFADDTTTRILIVITLAISLVFGYFLVRSVQREIEHREKIEKLAGELEVANKDLKELDRQKDELISIVSHQLATPVTSVKYYIEMFLDGDMGKLTPEQKESILTMGKVTGDLSDLVSMILDVSRIQLGKMKVSRKELDVPAYVREILTVIEPKAKEKKEELLIILPKDLLPMMLDKRLVRMTLENLLTNAVKYTPDGGKVTLFMERRGDTLHYEVRDTGFGIPKAEQGKIFGKLFRASNVVDKMEGNGFGLFAAKGAVEAQGGKIWFESEENKGTTFFVDLPIILKGNEKKDETAAGTVA